MNVYTVTVKQGGVTFQTDLPAISSWEAMRQVMAELRVSSAIGLLVSAIKVGGTVE